MFGRHAQKLEIQRQCALPTDLVEKLVKAAARLGRIDKRASYRFGGNFTMWSLNSQRETRPAVLIISASIGKGDARFLQYLTAGQAG